MTPNPLDPDEQRAFRELDKSRRTTDYEEGDE